MLETNQEAAEHLAQNSSVQTSISNNTKILGRNQNYHQLLYYELLWQDLNQNN